jgi:hypothetical protein
MRRAFLTAFFMALVSILAFLWNHRFERVPGLPVWRLADLRADLPGIPGCGWTGKGDDPMLMLRVDQQTPQVALRLAIPENPALEMLHLRYRMTAHGLLRGPEKWHTGRLMIEWHAPDGSAAPEMDLVGGIDLDRDSGPVVLIATPEKGPAVPALRLEHLGQSGEWELSDLEIIAVRERALWRICSWFLALCWLGWFFACVRSWPGVTWLRALGAASIWLFMGVHFAVPGPWKIQRPLAGDFRLGEIAIAPAMGEAPPLKAIGSPSMMHSGETSAHGNILPRGGLALRIRMLLAWARPLLHSLLFFAPVLASAWLVGRGPTLLLAVLLALAIEAAQMAYGYGFDWIDMLDLLTDAAGIALGLWLAGRFPWSGLLRIGALRLKGS